MLEQSLGRFGMVAPMVLDERSGNLVAGHGRLEALAALKATGQQPPARVKVGPGGDWMVPVVRGVGFANDVEAEAYLLTDNKSSELGGWDRRMLGEIVADLETQAAQLEDLGWTPEELSGLAAEADAAAGDVPPPEEFPTYDEDIETQHKCPRCGYEYSGGGAA